MKTKLKLDPTRIGYYLMLGYPIGIILYDGFLKFVLHLPTISDDVWAAGLSTRIGVSAYLLILAIALGLHFVFMLFDGGTEATPVAKEEWPKPASEISLDKMTEAVLTALTKRDENKAKASAADLEAVLKRGGDKSDGIPNPAELVKH